MSELARPVGRRGETRQRLLDAALQLFREHGVGGASLQMIADRLGVTKAAVYYQFPTKVDLVLAVVGPALDQLDEVLARAEPLEGLEARRDAAIEGLVDLVLDHRRVMAALLGDPGVAAVLHTHPELGARIERLRLLMHGPDPTVSQLIAGAMVGGALMSVGVEPLLADADRDVLRRELLEAAHRLLRS